MIHVIMSINMQVKWLENLKQPTLGWNPKKHIPFQDSILKCQDLILIYFNGNSTNIYHTKTLYYNILICNL